MNWASLIFALAVFAIAPMAKGIAFQEAVFSVENRLRQNFDGSNESFTLVEAYGEFAADWIRQNDAVDGSSPALRKICESLASALDQVAMDDPLEVDARISIARREQRQKIPAASLRDFTSKPLEGTAQAWSLHEKNRMLREKMREQIVPAEIRDQKIDTIAEQEQAVARIFSEAEPSNRSVQRLKSDLFLNQLSVHGPIDLASQRLFQEAMGWSPDDARKYFQGECYEEFEHLEIVPIKRRAVAEFLQTLDDSQMERLSRKLGIQKFAIVQIADITPASDLKRVFSNSIGKLQINYIAQEKLKKSTKIALGEIRLAIDSSDVNGFNAIRELQNVVKQLSAFPPGEFGDLAAELNEFKAEKSRLGNGEPSALRAELSNLIAILDKYQRDSTCPWKWAGVSNLDVQSSFGDLDDASLEDRVSIGSKQFFSQFSSERYLVADPASKLADLCISAHEGQRLGLPANQHVEILNAQVDHLQRNEFDDVAQRSAEMKAKLEIITNRLVPRQSAALSAMYSQYMFSIYGPYNYFQRQDIAADFGISTEQQKRMDEVAKHISDTIEDNVHPQVIRGFVATFARLSVDERAKLEELLDCKLDDLASGMLNVRGERRIREMLLRGCGTFYSPRNSTLLTGSR